MMAHEYLLLLHVSCSFRLLLGYGTSTAPNSTTLCVQKRNRLKVVADARRYSSAVDAITARLAILNWRSRTHKEIYLSFASFVLSFGADNGVQFSPANE